MHQYRPWADLPTDILSCIANRLELIELLSFRGTCKDFRAASSSASAELTSTGTPWIVFYNTNDSKCIIYDDKSSFYNRIIPDFQGAICLASYLGWLLLYKEGSIFFFSPFSFAKIILPDFKFERIVCHTAMAGSFSDLPTSNSCIVSIINNNEIIIISKGESVWTRHKVPKFANFTLTSVRSATFDHTSQTFYYMGYWKHLVTFSVKNKKFNPNPMKANDGLPYLYVEDTVRNTTYLSNYFTSTKKDRFFHLKDNEYVEVCGLTLHKPVNSRQLVYQNKAFDCFPPKKCVQKAVWIQPRFSEADFKRHW